MSDMPPQMSACRTTQDDTRIQHKRNAILSLHDSQDMDKFQVDSQQLIYQDDNDKVYLQTLQYGIYFRRSYNEISRHIIDKHLCKSVVLKCRKLVTLYLHLVCQAFSSGKSNIAVVAAVVARIRGVHYQQKQRYWTIRLHYSSAFHSSECFEIYSE